MAHLSVLHDSPEFIVVYKPTGMVTQGADALDNLLASARSQLDLPRVFPVHRLDQGTSGLVLLAKTEEACRRLSLVFQTRQICKIYLALIDQKPKKKQGWVIGDMIKSRDGDWRLSQNRANPARTYFFSFGLGDGQRLVVLKPTTGKTHQLRVALKAMGAPIVGDKRYGGSPADRLYLHAAMLSFAIDDTCYCFTSPPREGALFQQHRVVELLLSLGDLSKLAWPEP